MKNEKKYKKQKTTKKKLLIKMQKNQTLKNDKRKKVQRLRKLNINNQLFANTFIPRFRFKRP